MKLLDNFFRETRKSMTDETNQEKKHNFKTR